MFVRSVQSPEGEIGLTTSKPHWEWRSFDYQLHLWQPVLRDATPGGARSLTVETYLLSSKSPNEVKLRDGCVEVKQLLSIDASGLEQWQGPVRMEFPLDAEAFSILCAAWQLNCPETRPSFSAPEQLLSFLSRHAPMVRIVPVRKWRRVYRLDECMVERTTMLVGGDLLETLLLDHEDAAVLTGVLHRYHLDCEPNACYVTALKRVTSLSA